MVSDLILQKIDQTRVFLFSSQMDENEKDGYIDQLNAAEHAVRVSADPSLSQLVALRTCAETKQAVRLTGVIDKAVDKAIQTHAKECPIKGKIPTAKPVPVGTVAIIVDLFHNPWFCLFASVLAASPHAPAIITTIAKVFK